MKRKKIGVEFKLPRFVKPMTVRGSFADSPGLARIGVSNIDRKPVGRSSTAHFSAEIDRTCLLLLSFSSRLCFPSFLCPIGLFSFVFVHFRSASIFLEKGEEKQEKWERWGHPLGDSRLNTRLVSSGNFCYSAIVCIVWLDR